MIITGKARNESKRTKVVDDKQRASATSTFPFFFKKNKL